jgi:hypothetical protein
MKMAGIMETGTESLFSAQFRDRSFSAGTLHIRKPLLLRSQYTHYQFLTDIIRPHPKLNVVDIKKNRHGYLIDGAEVEIAELQIGAKHIKTVAIESDNTACVMKVRDQLKVRELPNVNYIKVLKKISGF